MSNEETNTGNSAIGMQGDSLEAAAEAPAPDSESFFNELEQSVNGGIIEENQVPEVTPSQQSGSKQATHLNQDLGSNKTAESHTSDNSAWEQRYKDSSREAVRLRQELNSLKPFTPVLDAMKQDSGLVNHVREYLTAGGAPAKTVQEKLNLPEDFEFDQAEAMSDPDSDSAKVMNAHVDGMVQQRVGQMLQAEKQNAQKVQQKVARQKEMQDFKTKHNMTDNQWQDFVSQAKERRLSMDDVYYLLNKDKTAQNVAASTKQDMLNQMKNVRNMPTTASGANSQEAQKSPDSTVFDGILGLDDSVDNLFG